MTINGEDCLHFPEFSEPFQIDGLLLVVSATTANWLVIHSEQLRWLTKLREGAPIRLVLCEARALGQEHQVKRVLKQILARGFASVERIPSLLIANPKENLHICLTNSCNLRCSHCYMYSGSPLKGELGVADWISAITEFSRLGGKNVTISGGELTCKPGWLDVIRQAAEAGLRVTILTNGTIWTEADIQSTAQLVAEVQVSVDGTSEQSNAAIRGAGFYKKALNTALEFANRGVRTSIAMTPGADEIGALAENIVAFDQHLRSRANGPIFIKISSNLIEGRHGSALPPEKLKLYEDAAKAASDRLYGNAAVRNFALGHPPNEGLSNCGFGCLALTADGDAFPCNRVHEVECQGNIKNEGLAVVMEKVLRLHSATSVDEMVPCRNCDVRYICGGGCRIEDFMFRGKPTFVDHGGLLPGSEHVDQCTCDGEWKTSLYRKMIATTHYQFSFDAE